MTIREIVEVPPADEKTNAIVAVAETFIGSLTGEQQAAAFYDFTDNTQRSN